MHTSAGMQLEPSQAQLHDTGPAAGNASCSLGRGWHAEPDHIGPVGKQLLWHVSSLLAAAIQAYLCRVGFSAKYLCLTRIPEQWGTQQGLPKLDSLLLHDNILAGSLPMGWEDRCGPCCQTHSGAGCGPVPHSNTMDRGESSSMVLHVRAAAVTSPCIWALVSGGTVTTRKLRCNARLLSLAGHCLQYVTAPLALLLLVSLPLLACSSCLPDGGHAAGSGGSTSLPCRKTLLRRRQFHPPAAERAAAALQVASLGCGHPVPAAWEPAAVRHHPGWGHRRGERLSKPIRARGAADLCAPCSPDCMQQGWTGALPSRLTAHYAAACMPLRLSMVSQSALLDHSHPHGRFQSQAACLVVAIAFQQRGRVSCP